MSDAEEPAGDAPALSPPLPLGAIRDPTPPYDAPSVAAYAVGQVAAYLRELLETDPVVSDLWVAGEVTSLSRSQAGHLYFTLGDAQGALRCVFFRRENLGVAVEPGDQVLAHGRVSLYTERGDLQLYVDAVQPQGVGVLYAEFQRLRARLEAEGLFESARKRPLPPYPRTVGVATSPAGAVWHDVRTVMERRWPLTGLLLAPCRVQGDGAAATIVAAIERLNALAAGGEPELDLILVARGGGSLEDLWAFNEEVVARAIFASALPVVSAVGHETDTTLADHVADLRAPTPSAAAELIVPDQAEERARLRELRSALGRALAQRASDHRTDLADLVDRLERRKPDLAAQRLRADDLVRRAEAALRQRLGAGRTSLAGMAGRLASLDPAATLARGYAVVQDSGGRPLAGAASLTVGERVRVRFSDGAAEADVHSVELS